MCDMFYNDIYKNNKIWKTYPEELFQNIFKKKKFCFTKHQQTVFTNYHFSLFRKKAANSKSYFFI